MQRMDKAKFIKYKKQVNGWYDKYYYLEYEDGFCIFKFHKYVGNITDEQVIEGLVNKLEQKTN